MPKGNHYIKHGLATFLCLLLMHGVIGCVAAYGADKPNVLLISVDDLNDWVGCLDGHPQVQTPNIDALAARGVLFANAHCQSPVCNPSRASMMASLYPETSGVYFLNPDPMASPAMRESVFLPKRFETEGYYVAGAGKLFHGQQSAKYWPNWAGGFGGFGPRPEKKISPYPGHPLWDWGAYPECDADMADAKIAAWGVQALASTRKKPFLLGLGFYRPHVPQYAPQKWFDLYPLDTVQLPAVATGDLDDVSSYGIAITRLKHVAPTHDWVLANDQWKLMVQSYLACVSFVDDQVGKLVRALDESPHRDNTYVVLMSDHGFHIGEKERHAKRSLWGDGTRTPLIIAGPGLSRGKVCRKPVQLLDIYPTLLALTGHAVDPKHEGRSLVSLLRDVDADWPHFARTSFGPGNVAIVSERYRFIRYHDGSEEFYDHDDDPNEWRNVITNPGYADVIATHRAALPAEYHAVLGKGSTGHQSFKASNAQGRRP
ncbi:MAG: sulfatase [Kiritimatiellae bacterium]|nr:sulfatase [Kiritimatiellia bacterium]